MWRKQMMHISELGWEIQNYKFLEDRGWAESWSKNDLYDGSESCLEGTGV